MMRADRFTRAQILFLMLMLLAAPVYSQALPQASYCATRADIAQTDTVPAVDKEALSQLSEICRSFYTGQADVGPFTLYFTDGMPAEGIITTGDRIARFRNGRPAPGWEGRTMYFDNDGTAVTGLYETEGRIYLFDDRGIMTEGLSEYNGNTYYSTPQGIGTGWVKTEEGEEYFFPDGKRAAGITQIDGVTYVLSETGQKLPAGICAVNGVKYAVGNQGEMRTGFVESNSGTVYAYPDGGIAQGVSVIDGKEYLFSQEGALIRNGWSEGKYAGSDGEIMRSCVADGIVFDPEGKEMPNYGYGNGGRLFIPDVGINVALQYDCTDWNLNQSICDSQDTALFYHACTYANDCIADHKHQGFAAIAGCVPGETMAYILRADGTVSSYKCIGITEGTNDGNTVTSDAGIDILDHSPYELQMYTCLEHWTHVKITFWERV